MKTKLIKSLLFLLASLSALHIGGWVLLTKKTLYDKVYLLYNLHLNKKPIIMNGDYMLFWFNDKYIGFTNEHTYFEYDEIQVVLFVFSLIWFYGFIVEFLGVLINIIVKFLGLNNWIDAINSKLDELNE